MSLELFASNWTTGIGRACWQGSLSVLVVWLVCKLLLQWAFPSTRATLWWIACIKFLVTLTVSATIAVPILSPVDQTVRSAMPFHAMSQGAGAHSTGASDANLPPGKADLGSQSADSTNYVSIAVLCAWVLGIGAYGGWILFQSMRLRSVVRSAASLDVSPLGGMVRAMGAQMGLDAMPRLVESSMVTAPMVVGLWQSTIILPVGFTNHFSDSEVRMAIAHELAHIRRRDLVAGLIPTICQLLFFFLPPVWLALREWSLEREAACDADAIAATLETPSGYGQMLMKIVTLDHQGGGFAPALGATHSYHTLRKRFEMVKSFAHPSRRVRYVSLAIVACGFGMVLPWQVTARAEAAPIDPMFQSQHSPEDAVQVRCRVLDASGKPSVNVLVQAQFNEDPKRFDGGTGLFTDKNGEVTFQLSWAKYRLVSFRAYQGSQFSAPKVLPVDGMALLRLHQVTRPVFQEP